MLQLKALWVHCCNSLCLPSALITSGPYCEYLVCVLSHFIHLRLFSALQAVDHLAPLSMEFSRQEYWSGLACPPPGDLPNLGVESVSPVLQADSLLLSLHGSPMSTLGFFFLKHPIFSS